MSNPMSEQPSDIAQILAAIYLAGISNGLGRAITDPEEFNHRREAFIKANPMCKEAIAALTARENRIRIDELKNLRKEWGQYHTEWAVKNRLAQLTQRSHDDE